MKRFITGITNTGIIVLLLAGLFVWAEPASAGVSEWSAETIPSVTNNMLGPAGIDVRDFAVGSDGKTIYAVTGNSAAGPSVIYKSVDTGVKWTALPVGSQADLIAVALDDNNYVIYSDNSTRDVYLSTDGGITWNTLNAPANTTAAGIRDIAISPARGGIHYIAIAGWKGANTGDVWYYSYGGAVPAWYEANNPADGFMTQNVTAALAFSPNFAADATLVAVTGNNSGVKLQLMQMSLSKWNNSASFTGYPCAVISANITAVLSASLTLSATYDATDDDYRNLFIGLTLDGGAAALAASGVYRLVDTAPTAIISGKPIHSVTYNSSTLAAGEYNSTTIYRVPSPLASSWTVTTYSSTSTKSPGGQNRVLLAWTGSILMAGTAGNESSFSVSRDNGATFTDISLIDTLLTNIKDVAVTTNAAKVYLVSDDGADTSVWYQVSGVWTRVFSKQVLVNCIVRIERTSGNIIYLAQKGSVSPIIYYNSSSGAALWLIRNCSLNVQDIAVESTTVAYVLDNLGKIVKSTNAGQSWDPTVTDTTLASGNMLCSISAGKLLAGSQNGYIAYSINGTSLWTQIPQAFDLLAGKMQVIPDQNFAANKIVYAASQNPGQDIKRWQIGVSTEWIDIFNGTVVGGIYGLALDSNTLYALELNAGQSKLWRYMVPTNATATSKDWVSIGVTATTVPADIPFVLNSPPQALKVSAGKLWAVKTNLTNKLFSFTDSVTNISITLGQPADGFINSVNSINGRVSDVILTWNRPSVASEYQVFISYDQNFNSISTNITVSSNDTLVSVTIGPNQAFPKLVDFQPGATYYWKLRITKPGYSLFSAVRSFSIAPLPVIPASSVELAGPVNGAVLTTNSPSFSWQPLQNTDEYEFVLSANADLSSPLLDARVNTTAFQILRKLESNKTYFWRVRSTHPIMGEWSPVGNFMVAAVVIPPVTTPVTTPSYTLNLPATTQTKIIFPPAGNTPIQIVPGYLVIAILIGLALTGSVLYLLFKRPAATVRIKGDFNPAHATVKQPGITQAKPLSPLESPKAVWPSAGVSKAPSIPPTPVTSEVSGAKPPLPKSKDAATVIFAARSFMWLSAAGNDAAPESPDKERESLGKKIAAKIRDLAKKEPLYIRHPEDAAMLLRLWARYGSGDETDKYLETALKSRPENAVRLIKCFLPQGTSLNDPASTSNFTLDNYRALKEVIDPDIVYAALTKASKFKPAGGKDAIHTAPEDSSLISRFMHLHLQEKNSG